MNLDHAHHGRLKIWEYATSHIDGLLRVHETILR